MQFEIRELQSPVCLANAMSHAQHECAHTEATILQSVPLQVDDERYVGFVNKVSDAASRLLTSRYNHEQLAYFGALVRTLLRNCLACVIVHAEPRHRHRHEGVYQPGTRSAPQRATMDGQSLP